MAGHWHLEVVTSCFDPYSQERQPWAQQRGDKWFYRVFIYLKGNHLPWVTSAGYYFGSNFTPPLQNVSRDVANPSCRLETWAWGEFQMSTNILLQNGQTVPIVHPFQFSNEINRHPGYRVHVLPAIPG